MIAFASSLQLAFLINSLATKSSTAKIKLAMKKNSIYADDNTESISTLLKIRLPSLTFGLILGVLVSFITSRFEQVLSQNVKVAFFLPFIMYMADAIGTQTQSIYSRNLKSGKAKFHIYFFKELLLGITIGIVFGMISGTFVQLWFADYKLTLSVGLSMFAVTSTSPIVALLITQAVQMLHKDPAAGSGPIDSVIQSMFSVLIYGTICSIIFLR